MISSRRNLACIIPLLALFLASIATAGCAGQRYSLAAPVTIPFELYHNRIYLSVQVNHTGPFIFVLDTGASMSGLDQRRAAELKLVTKHAGTLLGNGEHGRDFGLAHDVTLTVGSIDLAQKQVAVLSFIDIERYEGHRIDGVLGAELFRRYVVEADYAQKTLVLWDAAQYRYNGSGQVMPLRFHDNAALLNAQIEVSQGISYDAELAIDLGTYSALRLYKRFIDSHNLLAKVHAVPGTGFGLGGEFPEAQGRVQVLKLGNIDISGPTTGFSQASAGATATSNYAGTVGGEIFRRFKVILDYPHSRIILEPSAALDERFFVDNSGLVLTVSETDASVITICRVLQSTPAAQAGLKVGDALRSIDGKTVSAADLDKVRTVLRRPGEHRIEIKRATEQVSTVLTNPEVW